MTIRPGHAGSTPLAATLLLGASLLVPAGALAHGEAGEHVEEFQEHLDDYAADVRTLADSLDALARDYAAGEAGPERVQAFVDEWEEVRYHAAVETVATPLYPAIWQAISGLRQAVDEGAEAEVVHERTDAVAAALHQGMGGLRLTAARGGGAAADDHGHDEPAGPEAAFQRIDELLDSAVAEYQAGHADDALELVRSAYFDYFEGLEGGLIEVDAQRVARLEEDFNGALPQLLESGASVDEVREQVQAMKESLDTAEGQLEEAGDGSSEVF